MSRLKNASQDYDGLSPDDFDERTDISGYVCHFKPCSFQSRKPMFENIEMKREE
jgi:hypothetical protein